MNTLPSITDPQSVSYNPQSTWVRFWLRYIRDPRDMAFINLTSRIMLMVILLGVLLYLPFIQGWLWWSIAIVYLYLNNFVFKGPFGLMNHCIAHRRLFKKEYDWMHHIHPWVIGPFFGQSPDTYFSHHIGMHHVENNLEDDDSSTMFYQRDSLRGFFMYYMKFMFKGLVNLAEYLRSRRKFELRRKAIIGEIALFVMWVVLCLINWQATVVVFILPFVVSRLIMMVGNWAQHAFVDYDEPANYFRSSITCINTDYNHKCFNDGYHTSHHIRPGLHWTEYPAHLRENLDAFVREQALIFHGIHYLHIWWYLMTKRYDRLADQLLNIDGSLGSRAEMITLLQSRTRRMPRRGITMDHVNELNRQARISTA